MSTTSQPPKGRNLIVAFDGTADTYDNDITNIIRLVGLLDKASPDEQLVYYQPGIGTYVDPSFMFSPTMRKVAQLLDQGVAWYLDGHIMGGYQFLMDNYRPGDKILLFGFSRGAYTARCLAGMLHKVGLLPRNNKEQVQFAYECYKDSSDLGETRAQGFKKAFSVDVLIEFMGVWDTVAAVGVFYSRHLPFTSSNTIVRTFRHALALDERRAKFQANTWHRDAKDKKATAKDPECGSAIKSENKSNDTLWSVIKTLSGKTFTVKSVERNNSIDECADAHEGLPETDIKEVWFAGCHADVGGGSVTNDTKSTLAHPSMRWMVNEILDHTSVKFNQDAVLLQLGIDCKAQSEARRSKFLPTPVGSKFSVTDNRFFASPAEAKVAAAQVPLVGIPAAKHNNADVVQSPVEATNGSTAPTTAVTDSFPISPKTEATHVDDTGSPGPKHAQEASTQTVLTVAEEKDYEDATSPSYDMLRKKPMWWLLELIPMKSAYQDEDGTWHTTFGWNMGRGRNIRQSAPLFHSSVKTRMEAGPQNLQGGAKQAYTPLATFLGPPTYVD